MKNGLAEPKTRIHQRVLAIGKADSKLFRYSSLYEAECKKYATAKSMRNSPRPSRNCERLDAILATGGTVFELFCYTIKGVGGTRC